MTDLHFDFVQARQNMVENQLRPAEVNHTQLIEIMRSLPREECVNESQREIAYADINIPLSENRFLSEPRVIARLVQLANVQCNQKILVVGAGTGYLASLINLLEANVFAVEEDEFLSQKGQHFCEKYTTGVQWYTSKMVEGCPDNQPFDTIVIDGAVNEIPQQFVSQLKQGGHIITVLKQVNKVSQAVVAERMGAGLIIQHSFYAALPVLSELK